jgi:hypothetical protein
MALLRCGRVCAAIVLLVTTSPGAAASTAGPERILAFDSRIEVNADAGMLVTETITVLSTGDQIRRGIFRDFPTSYRDRSGNRYVVGFAVQAVTRDGKPEAWRSEDLSNGVRIYIGQKKVFLPPGEHTYTLTYRTDRQLGFFKAHDELYWNVTGNDWAFAIDRVTARVELPPGVPGTSLLEAYTGPAGAQGNAYTAEAPSERTAVFRTTRGLAPREGLTIVVGWPKGFVREPSSREKTWHFFKDNRSILTASIGLVLVLLYYALVWFAVGKDPQGGSIMPIYSPPENMSPAAMRFIAEMGYDDKAFAAAVIDMAVKGHLTIAENGKTTTLKKTGGGAVGLSPDEQKIASQLFGSGNSIVLERKNHARIGGAKNALKTALSLACEKRYFLTNRKAFITGAVLSVAAVALGFLSSLGKAEVIFLGVWLSGWSIGVAFLAAMVVKLWRGVFESRRSGSRVGTFGAAVFMTLFAIPFFGAEIFALATLFRESPPLTVLPIIMAAINIIFYHLLKAPTLLGRRTLDQVEGFKMFLAATEGDRLQRMYPGDRTPVLFERFLPYAFALGVEQQWTDQFSDVLSASAHPGSSGGYHPGWYSGRGWDGSNMGGFAGSVGSSLSSAISSSSTAPGSSSGGGGGGSSGGGGGGGGGGGW